MTNTNETLRAVQFGFHSVGPFDGLTDGSTWNGWLNVWVKAETHAKVIEEMRKEDCAEQFEEMEPEKDGTYSYANGFCTAEWTIDTFEEFQQSRREVDNIGKELETEEIGDGAGFVYAGGCCIEKITTFLYGIEQDPKFYTIIGNAELIDASLEVVERWLWDNWAEAELT